MANTTTNLNKLEINVLTAAQYKAASEAGTINEDALYMTEEKKVDYATTYMTTITTTTTWTKNSNYYVQQVDVNGITASDTPIIDIITSVSNFENELEAYSKIFKITTSTNSISIYSSEVVNIALTLQIKVVK